jgi:hypothetical protein
MMTTDRDKLPKTVARAIAIIGEVVPDLTTARDLLDRFHRLIQQRRKTNLPFCFRSLQRQTQRNWSAVALDGQNNHKQPCSKILAEYLTHVSPNTGVYNLREIGRAFRRV